MAPSFASARELVLTHGWNSTSYQILNCGIDHWFAPGGRGVVGFVRRGRVLLAAGAPICDRAELLAVCNDFERFARTQGCTVCYVCAGDSLRSVLARGHSSIALGAQPVWDPCEWPRFVRHHSPLRRQLNRSRNKSVTIEAMNSRDASRNPDLRAVFEEWLGGRPLPPLGFLASPDVLLPPVPDRVFLVARQHGTPVAFLAASPIAARNGYLVELLARSSAAPNGTSELLIDSAMRRFAEECRGYVTLGLVALAHAADCELSGNPAWLRGLMRLARAHANRFYHFRGLEHFRAKLSPKAWEPLYAISNKPRFSARTLYAMGSAFSGIPPWLAIGIALSRALQAECSRALRCLGRFAPSRRSEPGLTAGYQELS